MAVATRAYTWDDIKDWPETAERNEIVHGELIVSPTPRPRHGKVNNRIARTLSNFVVDHAAGEFFVAPTGIVFAPDVVYEPDMCFVHRSRLEIIQETHIAGPPDLIIEIVSESNRSHDTVVKFADYARYGVKEYWLVDLRERAISTYALSGGKYELLAHARGTDLVRSLSFAELQLRAEEAFA